MILAGLIVAAAACASGAGGIAVEDPWARSTPPGAATAAFFMTITNDGTADELVAVDATGCSAVEIHQTTMTDGVMSMSQVAGGVLPIPADGEVALESGGVHLMCIGVADRLRPGDVVPLTLRFGAHPDVAVDAMVR